MKILKYIFIFLGLLILPVYSYPSPLGSIRLSLIQGEVQIRTEDTEEWVPASINLPLKEGDRIWVPEAGKAELQLREGTLLRLDENTALEILTDEKDSFQFYLTEGKSYVNFRGLEGTYLQMDTPISSIRTYEKSIFRVDVTPEGFTDLYVYRGYVNAENRDGITRVDSGNALSQKEETYAELTPLGPPDEWERWNRERDRLYAERRPPARYLPEELQVYSTDFERNGRWVYVREYGYVWTPRVVISVGWAPYRIGRWVWIRGDYVWVSYEPWGWVPYHYGRWAFVGSIGWCWVPPPRGAVFWGPGFVAWVHTPTYISWVPLAPGEIYYGRGDYGPHSVNITQVNVTHIDIHKVVYRNVRVRDAVTVVHHDTFVKGRPVDLKVRENPFLKGKISVGRPEIKPEKTTLMPVIKEIPHSKRPPETIREIRVRELKEKRPFVRQREASVIRPELPPKEMPLRVKEGKPLEREFKKREGPPPIRKEKDRSVGTRPSEKEWRKIGPESKGDERMREIKPSKKGESEKTLEAKPLEGESMGRPREDRLPEKVPGTLKGPKSSEKGGERLERSEGVKPSELEKGGSSEERMGGTGRESPTEGKIEKQSKPKSLNKTKRIQKEIKETGGEKEKPR